MSVAQGLKATASATLVYSEATTLHQDYRVEHELGYSSWDGSNWRSIDLLKSHLDLFQLANSIAMVLGRLKEYRGSHSTGHSLTIHE